MQSRLSALLVALALGCSNQSADSPRPTSASAVEEPPVSDLAPAPRGGEVPADEPTPPPVEDKVVKAESIELTFVGDVIFGRYRASGFDPIPEGDHEVFAEIAEQLASDVLIGNLETPLVRELPESSPIGARYSFGASREMAEHLVKGGFTAVSLANNHWFDQRREGVTQTPELLEELGVIPIGEARDEPPVFKVVSFERKGWRLGFVSITARSNAPMREGFPIPPFLPAREFVQTIGPILEEARADHDLLGVLVHWGDEYEDAPAVIQRMAAKGLIDAGADMVIGHHPHVLQGFERHEHGVIAYSLGNFLFENTNDPARLTGVLRLRYEGDSRCAAEVVFHPAYVRRMPVQHPVPATGFMGRKSKDRLRALSKRMGSTWEERDDDLVLASPSCP